MNTQPKLLQMLATLVIDYFRWSQLTPMILMWAFMLGLLLVMFIIGNQDATWTLIERVTASIASLPWIGPRFMAFMESQAQDGKIDIPFGTMDLKSMVLTAWGFISAGFMLLAWIAGRLFGPFKPWTLKRKLGFTALACVGFTLVFVLLYFLDIEMQNDPLSKALFSSSGMSLILFIVSAWCLTVSHLLGWVSSLVAEANFGKSNSDGGLV